ncbi:hypothetical protein GGG16DRAFT_106908, partial [Schizophyllum commune]
QKFGRIRGFGAALAVVLVPNWVKIIPNELIQSKQQQEDRDRRAKLPRDLLRFLNAGRADGYRDEEACCPRALDCMLNEEPFILRAPCCNVHAGESATQQDIATVDRWAAYLKPVKAVSEELRTDKTFRSLARYPAMLSSLAYILDSWARRTYAGTIRTEATVHLPSSFIFPRTLLESLPEKAHLCTTLPRLHLAIKTILPTGWAHFETYGQSLLDVLQVAMAGYTDIIREASRKASLRLDKMNKDILERLCRHYKVPIEGKLLKNELKDRLVEHLAENGLDEPSPELLTQFCAESETAKQAKVLAKNSAPSAPPSSATGAVDTELPLLTADTVSPLSPSKRTVVKHPRPKPKARKREDPPLDKENDPFIIKRQRLY